MVSERRCAAFSYIGLWRERRVCPALRDIVVAIMIRERRLRSSTEDILRSTLIDMCSGGDRLLYEQRQAGSRETGSEIG